jgi:hypothetical protein
MTRCQSTIVRSNNLQSVNFLNQRHEQEEFCREESKSLMNL